MRTGDGDTPYEYLIARTKSVHIVTVPYTHRAFSCAVNIAAAIIKSSLQVIFILSRRPSTANTGRAAYSSADASSVGTKARAAAAANAAVSSP
jgi:hypothetical protein